LPTEASAVFINYRREDSAASAGRLFDRLADHVGPSKVFMDVYAIKPGENWIEAIDRAVAQCELMLVLIGPLWIKVGADGRRRIDDPGDRVRLEIEAAFKHHISVIPLLLEDARMPDEKDLPPSLAALSHRQALRVQQETYQADSDRLLAAIEDRLSDRHRPRASSRAKPEHRRHRAVAIGAALAVLAAGSIGLCFWWLTKPSESPLQHAERTAIGVVDGFWQEHFTMETGRPYNPPTAVSAAPAVCGNPPNPYIMYYCPVGDVIVINEDLMRAEFAQHGISWLYLAFAHDWGNAVQLRLQQNIQFERADCYAGAALQGAFNDGKLSAADLQGVVELLPAMYGDSHPRSAEEFRKGASGGVAACR
jgi:hypothetical protein